MVKIRLKQKTTYTNSGRIQKRNPSDSFSEKTTSNKKIFPSVPALFKKQKRPLNDDISVTSRHGKRKTIEDKQLKKGLLAGLSPKSVPSEDELHAKGYPKKKLTHAEIQENVDPETGQKSYTVFFNVENYLKAHPPVLSRLAENNRLLYYLDHFTYDSKWLDRYEFKHFEKVTHYNWMSPQEQYTHDIIQSRKKQIGAGVLALTVIAYLLLTVLPNYQQQKAYNQLLAGNYEQALTYYSKQGSEGAPYAQLSDAFLELDKGNLENAYHLMKALQSQQEQLSLVQIGQLQIELMNRIAQQYAAAGNPVNAALIYKEISYLSEYKLPYQEQTYLASLALFEKGDYEQALSWMKSLEGYKDAEEQWQKMAQKLYHEALELYNTRQLSQARTYFETLASYGYQNAETLQQQTFYILGVEAFQKTSYEEAKNLLLPIATFKDSQGILTEIAYQQGLEKMNTSIAAAYPYFVESSNYKDSYQKLTHPSMVLYGHWQVTHQGSALLKNQELSYYLDGRLETTATLEALPNGNYEYQEDKYQRSSSDNTLQLEVISPTKIIVIATHNGASIRYTLQKTRTLDEVQTTLNTQTKIKRLVNQRIKQFIPSSDN